MKIKPKMIHPSERLAALKKAAENNPKVQALNAVLKAERAEASKPVTEIISEEKLPNRLAKPQEKSSRATGGRFQFSQYMRG